MDDDDVSEPDNETDQTKEQMVMETIQLNRELNKLNKELAMKEHLAAKLIESVSHIGEYCPEENTEELKNKLEQLKQERDQLEEALKVAQTNNINSKYVFFILHDILFAFDTLSESRNEGLVWVSIWQNF